MIGQFPEFDNDGFPKKQLDNSTGLFKQTCITIEIPEQFESIQDVKTFLCQSYRLNTIEDCNELKKYIETKKVVKFLISEYKNITSHINIAFNQIPLGSRTNELETLANDLKKALTTSINKSALFIYNNQEEIFQLLDEKRLTRVNELKEKRKQANKKYYEKQKSLLSEATACTVGLTEEEKIQSRKEKQKQANKKYYEKQRQELNIEIKPLLTEEEKIQSRKEANKRYYEQKRQELNIEIKPLLTEEQKKENRKEANKKYYDKKRQKNEE